MEKPEMTDEEFIKILDGEDSRYSEEDVQKAAEIALKNVLKEFDL